MVMEVIVLILNLKKASERKSHSASILPIFWSARHGRANVHYTGHRCIEACATIRNTDINELYSTKRSLNPSATVVHASTRKAIHQFMAIAGRRRKLEHFLLTPCSQRQDNLYVKNDAPLVKCRSRRIARLTIVMPTIILRFVTA